MNGVQKVRLIGETRTSSFRLLGCYVLVPFVPSILLFLRTPRGVICCSVIGWEIFLFIWCLRLRRYADIGNVPVLFGFPFGSAGPDLFAFMGAGAVFAGLTSYAVLRGGPNLQLIEFFVVAGIVCGFCFRLILFGVGRQPGST